MTTKIAVKGVTKIFGKQPDQALALLRQGRSKEEIFARTGHSVGVHDAGFEVRAGEIFVVMGLSGSGKSTLVRLLNRLIEPSAGEILIDGQDILKMPAGELMELRRRDLGMVFQSFALMPHLTVRQNAAFGLEIAGVDGPSRRDKAQRALEAVGLGAYAESMPGQLSGGMQQRVGLARALANEPSILLMDEAFSALDPLIRTEMQDELLRLQREHSRTIVFISHDLDEAIRIGDRLAIMEGGRIVQVGRPDEILRHPANDYVRAFFRNVDVTKVLTAGDIARRDRTTPILRPDESPDAALRQLRERERPFAHVEDGLERFRGVVTVESLLVAAGGAATLDAAYLPGVDPVPAGLRMDAVRPRVAASPFPLPVVGMDGRYRGAISRTAYLENLGRTF